MNELYRQFRVGNVLTLANSSLRPERANGAEAGTDVQLGASLLRFTGFWTELRDPVSNVTLSIDQLILRQRQNVGRARIRGLEADWEWRFRRKAQFRLSYLFDDARVRRFAPDPGLEGLRLPQVARHQGFLGLQLPIWRGGILHLQTRLSGVQFDDDRNQLPLAGFAQADLAWTQPLGNHLEWFLRASNLFDRRYPVARTPPRNPRRSAVGAGRSPFSLERPLEIADFPQRVRCTERKQERGSLSSVLLRRECWSEISGQNWRSVSRSRVTGPSFTNSTSIMAWKTPCSTGTLCSWRNSTNFP